MTRFTLASGCSCDAGLIALLPGAVAMLLVGGAGAAISGATPSSTR
jgi:hypothetical protein